MKAVVASSFKIRDAAPLVEGELRSASGLSFAFLENGSLFSITHGDIMFNQVLGNPIDGALGNIYLRLLGQPISFFPVMGPRAESRFGIGERGASWQGSRQGIAYRCSLRLSPEEPMWFWSVQLRNTTDESQAVDVVLAQDLGLGAPAAVRTNELYTSQYIDHTAYDAGERGWVVCSRQNQAQGTSFPWILQGCLEGAAGYLTDGFQFFGLSYKGTNVPEALTAPQLPSTTYQYELAFPTLQSRKMDLSPGEAANITFFAVYEPDHPAASSPQDLTRVDDAVRVFHRIEREATGAIDDGPATPPSSAFDTAPLFPAQPLTSHDLDRYFSPERRHVEEQDGNVLSFFYGPENHVVLKEKELLTERPHGHIIRSGRHLVPDEDTLSLTAWMFGCFASHVAIGNTNFDKLLTVSRNPLNVLKSSGQRIFVKTPTGYTLLGLPSAFEMGLNSARWIYKGEDTTIVVRIWTSTQDPACFLELAVEGSGEPEFLISHNIVLGDTEFESAGLVLIDAEEKRVELIPAPDELMGRRYPDARFVIVSSNRDAIEELGGDGLLFSDGQDRNYPYVTVKTRPVRQFTLTLTGNVPDEQRASALADKYASRIPDYENARRESDAFWRGVRKDLTLHGERDGADIAKVNDALRWFAHDAVLHFTTLYGLEQYSGAAWGVRDVCQGPAEFLLATRHFDVIKFILRTVYAHQFEDSGDWPQWFMLDPYWDIYAPDSHADIVIWPLKALCEYIEATADFAILDEEIPFTDSDARRPTTETAPLFAHTLKQIDRMERSCLPGTALALYGHGDWEDTLQPVDPAARERLVSPWTVELMYQTLRRYAHICERVGQVETSGRLTDFCDRIRADFNRYLMRGGVVAGLVEFGADTHYLLHPQDERTGVHYRLLPMTRGMLSGMFTAEQMQTHRALIDEHLTFPDGVRLMDRPMAYRGGVETIFRRAESAANFGREVGLQYVHAHIRYVEAMARIGQPEKAYRGLLTILPIAIQDVVPAALRRQSNAYFSSSDAAFPDRYAALRDFNEIKTSEVGVKGGWRVYSSGPGMTVAELVWNILGLREYFDDVLLDPVLPKSLDGLTVDFEYAGRPVRYRYGVSGQGFSPQRVIVNDVDMGISRYSDNPYRSGGALIPKAEFIGALDRTDNLVEIEV